MNNTLTNMSEYWFDFNPISTESITVPLDKIEQAVKLSSKIPEESRQWQTYLNALALFGFEEWLEKQGSNLTINSEKCSIFNPVMSNSIPAVCHLDVNQFQVCLITKGSIIDDEISIPRVVLDLPEFSHHLYVVIEVQEELDTVVVYGFLSYQDLIENQTRVNLLPDADWNYSVSLNWFDTETDNLLLYFRCLNLAGIPLPEVQTNPGNSVTVKDKLATLLPQLSEESLWQIFNWEQGAIIFTNYELLQWIYDWQWQKATTARHPLETEINSLAKTAEKPEKSLSYLRKYLPDLLQILTDKTINVGYWLTNELDNFANELSWVLLPELYELSAMRGMRSATEEIEAIIRELPENGVDLPAHAKGAYQDLLLAGIPLRLYALTWSLVLDSTPEWTLLLILSAPVDMSLPEGVKLRVSDATDILVEQSLDSNDDDSYLFYQVVGNWNEKFIVTVYLTPEIQETLPPFEFLPRS
ncbi:MAG: DUF1822 family protein [Microcoleaceae cyanobacterium]